LIYKITPKNILIFLYGGMIKKTINN